MGGGGLHAVGGSRHQLLEAVVKIACEAAAFLTRTLKLNLGVAVFAHHIL
jgi:hypothetical protein